MPFAAQSFHVLTRPLHLTKHIKILYNYNITFFPISQTKLGAGVPPVSCSRRRAAGVMFALACRRCHVPVVSYDHARLFPRDCKIFYGCIFSVCDSISVANYIFTLSAAGSSEFKE